MSPLGRDLLRLRLRVRRYLKVQFDTTRPGVAEFGMSMVFAILIAAGTTWPPA